MSEGHFTVEPSQYIPFQAFLQQFDPSQFDPQSSNLVPTAPEFVPRQPQGPISALNESQGAIPRNPNPVNGVEFHNRRGLPRRDNFRNGYQNHHLQQYNPRAQQRERKQEFHNGHQPRRQRHPAKENAEFATPRDQSRDSKQHKDRQRNGAPSKQFSKSTNMPRTRPIIETKCQREKLIREITANTLECLVCCERIKDHNPVWSCNTCFHILHMKCVSKWALSSKDDDGTWRCPACQGPKTQIPQTYLCFCGKQRNPTVNRVDTAHSCGEVCGNPCDNGHSCTILCHPGPHPACQATVQRSCYCGKTQKVLQCSQREEIKCSCVCGKLLSCQLHTCDQTCHAGECKTCPETSEISCHCGKETKTVPCSINNETFVCRATCGRALECGNHSCEAKCHAGPCQPCSLLPTAITSCPCGKQQVLRGERKSCLDEIPTCKSTCKRVLKCGPPGRNHICEAQCHTGECPPCNKKTVVKCRCGNMDQEMKCKQLVSRADDARCKKKCGKSKMCLRHKCQELCCIDFDHVCKQNCNRTLSCGKHKCALSCHRGNCPTCERVSFDELHCECGFAVIYPPIPCGTKRPVCDRPCSRSHSCDHEVLHPCHTDPKCPPCVILTTKWCYGGHEQRKTIPCHEPSFCCGMPCAKPLASCDHGCIKNCHTGDCQAPGDVCRQKCQKPREDCSHACNVQCHFGKECPESNCREMVEVQCPCGNIKRMRACSEFTSEFRRIANAQLAATMQEMQNGGVLVNLSELMGGSKSASGRNTKVLECNEECRLLERNRRLEMALGPRDPTKINMPTYSDFLKGFARKDSQLIRDVHDKLTNLVKLAKESKQKSRSHSFPVMNREKRQMIHEMCEAFGVASQAYDAEPNRNVVATAHREMCFCPTMSVMEVVQRETGQRVRLPVSHVTWKTPK